MSTLYSKSNSVLVNEFSWNDIVSKYRDGDFQEYIPRIKKFANFQLFLL